MNMFKKNGGFTLVELIVVIAILAILAGIAIPAYSGYIAKAKDTEVETELAAISTAAMAANATEGAITEIKVKDDIQVSAASYADEFEADFEAFYTAATADTTKDGKMAFDSGKAINFAGSSYEGKTATWTPATGWEAK